MLSKAYIVSKKIVKLDLIHNCTICKVLVFLFLDYFAHTKKRKRKRKYYYI